MLLNKISPQKLCDLFKLPHVITVMSILALLALAFFFNMIQAPMFSQNHVWSLF